MHFFVGCPTTTQWVQINLLYILWIAAVFYANLRKEPTAD